MTHQMPKKRDTGLDILRILAMYMVVIWHAPTFHFCWWEPGDSADRYQLWNILVHAYQVFGVDGVNVFALLTGYLCINTKWHADRYVHLWLQSAFYGVGLFVIWWVLQKAGVLPEVAFMSAGVMEQLIIPPGVGLYWYVVAYTGLFFLIPFINTGIQALDKRRFQLLLLASVGIAITIGWRNATIASAGYSTLWLCCLYILGAYFRLHPVKHRPLTYALVLIGFLSVKSVLYTMLIRSCVIYSSIFDVAESVLWLLIVSRIQIRNEMVAKVVAWLSLCSFGVYLIHTHPFAIYLIHLFLGQFDLDRTWGMIWLVPVWSIGLYLACSVVDTLRKQLFSLCRVKPFCSWVSGAAASLLDKALGRINK